MSRGLADEEHGIRNPIAQNNVVGSNAPRRKFFLELLTGSRTKPEESSGCEYLIERVKTMIDAHRDCGYPLLLHADFENDQAPFERFLQLLCAIMNLSRNTPGISIHKLRQRLVEDRILRVPDTSADELSQKYLLFSSVGWLTCLYLPSDCFDQNKFGIETASAKRPQRTSIDVAKAQRPLDEFLSAFGEMLPPEKTAAREPRSNTDVDTIKFHVSCLNAETLESIGKIRIIWVDTIIAHLDFDPTLPALYLFRSPAFYKSQIKAGLSLSL